MDGRGRNMQSYVMKKALFSLLFVSLATSAEFMTGNALLSNIQSTDSTRKGFAMGYIAGVADANQSITYCPPESITLGQLRDMTEQYLISNASIRNLSADVLIGDMLNLRWPCKQQTPGRGI
jgi:hypothetical protein